MKQTGLIKKYKLKFNPWGLLLFGVIMIPNVIWGLYPATNDILRGESITEIVDFIGSICQVIMIASLCCIVNRNCRKMKMTAYMVLMLINCALYFIAWVLYYIGWTNCFVILLLTIPPCLAFLFFAIDRKNIFAILANILFMICHVIYALQNFII